VFAGDNVNFTLQWTDQNAGDQVSVLVCRSPGLSGQACANGLWASGSPSSESPSTASGATTQADIGLQTFFAYACDSWGQCSQPLSGSFLVLLNPADPLAGIVKSILEQVTGVASGLVGGVTSASADALDDLIQAESDLVRTVDETAGPLVPDAVNDGLDGLPAADLAASVQQKALFGAWVGCMTDPAACPNDGGTETMTKRFEQGDHLGRRLDINMHYFGWDPTNDPFYPNSLKDLKADLTNGRIPMVTWQPFGIELRDILNGSQDNTIRAYANQLRDLFMSLPSGALHRVFLRFGHEPNGNWYPWSGANNENNPKLYRQAWRRVWSMVSTIVAPTNGSVIWVFSPNAESVPKASTDPWNDQRYYYPGKKFVDRIAFDGYNWGDSTVTCPDGSTEGTNWRDFTSIFTPIANWYKEHRLGHPESLMISETGSATAGGDRGQWMRGAQAWVVAHPRVKAFMYFNLNATLGFCTDQNGDQQVHRTYPIAIGFDNDSAALEREGKTDLRNLARSCYFWTPKDGQTCKP
jgi:hypothetical protein